jgi:hypothetical protein
MYKVELSRVEEIDTLDRFAFNLSRTRNPVQQPDACGKIVER